MTDHDDHTPTPKVKNLHQSIHSTIEDEHDDKPELLRRLVKNIKKKQKIPSKLPDPPPDTQTTPQHNIGASTTYRYEGFEHPQKHAQQYFNRDALYPDDKDENPNK